MSTHRATATPQVTTQPRGDVEHQAFLLLRTAFTVAPVVFGLDKFFNVLTDWQQYLAPAVDRIVPGTGHQMMLAVGLVEVVAGVVVAGRPQLGDYLVAAWLACIITNLLLIPGFYDVALRDFGLLLAALALALLASTFPASWNLKAAQRRGA